MKDGDFFVFLSIDNCTKRLKVLVCVMSEGKIKLIFFIRLTTSILAQSKLKRARYDYELKIEDFHKMTKIKKKEEKFPREKSEKLPIAVKDITRIIPDNYNEKQDYRDYIDKKYS